MTESLIDKIVKMLIETNKINEEDLKEAHLVQKRRGIGLEKILIEKGLIREEDFLALLVQEVNIPFINLRKYKIDPTLKDVIPENIARQYKIVPISSFNFTITIATSDPLDVVVIDDLKNITGKEVDVVMSTSSAILEIIDKYYGSSRTTESITDISRDIEVENFEIVTEEKVDEAVEGMVDESEKAPIIRMVNLIIKEALKQRASDIHIEPTIEGLRVRYRIDGILQDIISIPKENQNAVTVRVKIMSRVDITAIQTPQDGRFKLKLSGKEVDFRVSFLPTIFGHKIVMRILDKQKLSVGLGGLGFEKKSLQLLQEAIKKPFGMILVTGPTGSGKSTTLYSVINELNTVDKNIITVEDPVEYLMEGLTQIQARPEIGLTFAQGLRAILRQSPDIVMVGEIRDNETADIAIKASLTGQLVFSTLHTNDSAGALTRLIDMGVEPFLVASSIVLVSAQRLCRRICPHCKEKEAIPKKVLERLNCKFKPDAVFYKGKGCDLCRNTGYLGRMGIAEILDVDDNIRDLLLKGKSSDEIKEFARKEKGMVTLLEDAVEKLASGQTTLEEILRVTSQE